MVLAAALAVCGGVGEPLSGVIAQRADVSGVVKKFHYGY